MKKIGIIGLGNMGYPIYKSISNEFTITCYDPFSNRTDIEFSATLSDLEIKSEVIIVCVKPDKIAEVLKKLTLPKKIISIAAGITLNKLKEFSPPDSQIVRIMPNLPLQIKEGCMGYIGDKSIYPDVKSIFEQLGLLIELSSEDAMDAFTGLAGSGPAYVFSFIQALAEGGVKSGLSYSDALKLSLQTVKGSAMLLEEEFKSKDTHPMLMRNKVTSAGGTTIYGLEKLEENKFHFGVMSAVFEAFKRSNELRGK
ncbi:MAG: pyrroline-5-carboxylate reductase [Leptospiraceae bacterium]|nr:pyrroline-5-carboxylate reductase [Leptospiraceae bacterium]